MDWLLRNQDGELTERERETFETWRAAAPENAKAYAAAERLMGDARTAIADDPTLRATPAQTGGVGKPVVAATLVAAATLFVVFDGPMRMKADMISGKEETPVFILPDGSTVQLNASTAVTEEYSADRRTLRLLRGQAYFEVKADPDRPFIVEAGETRVTALGTAFDVRLGDETDVSVTQHSVLVEFTHDRPAVRLEEGEQIAYEASSGELAKGADGKLAASWRDGQLVVDNKTLSFVIEELNRKFSGRILIARLSLQARKVSGVIRMSDKSAALSFVAKSLGLRVVTIGPITVLL
ncbi:transmembrane sensor [Methylopila capsulata]|uniref:Iron dicitrate transporter FecR n=1 Tax=Methylopila capsulata TaxID=61654 RepID=A0A9W6IWI6_9HYPH|nr:FecR family protein [Methylopila capsulata]MBM7852365.1 transmembrane sensor [Methylopila capsulata]GLK56574.1 iron dicitrate transporter FecR [Methylopila capsulata]